MAAGTLFSLTLPLAHIFYEPDATFYIGLTCAAPFCFLPTIFRCVGSVSLSAVERFLSYGLLPIGSWIFLVQLDRWFRNTLINLIALCLISAAWFAGGRYKRAAKDAW